MIFNTVESIIIPSVFYDVPSEVLGIPFYLKLEHLNMAGSIKIKTAKYLIHSLEIEGKLTAGKNKVIESSSGNLGVALSIVCRSKGYPFICVTDPNTISYNSKLMHLYGAEVICVQERDASGGFLGTRLKLIESLLKNDPNLVWTNQYANPYNIKAHYETTAQEIAKQFSNIDYLFIGAGTTGTLMGCAEYFRQHRPNTKIIAVDVEGSVTFNQVAKKRNIPGLGTSKRPPIVNEALLDDIIYIDEKTTIQTCYLLLEKTGLLLGGSSGSVAAAIQQYKNKMSNNSVVVAISPDDGLRYVDTIYEPNWVKEKILNS